MSFKDMPLDTTLQKGDVVTITGPGEHDALVREVTGPKAGKAGLMYFSAAVVESVLRYKGRTLTRVQRPVPVLPTVEGDYILTMTDGFRAVRTLREGVWWNATGMRVDVPLLTKHVENGATLTRVIPADEVRHPEVDVSEAVSTFMDRWASPNGSAGRDFESVLIRVLEGEFDL